MFMTVGRPILGANGKNHFSVQTLEKSPYFSKNTYLYFPISHFTEITVQKVQTLIEPSLLESLKLGKIKIIIDHSTEAFFQTVNYVYDVFVKYFNIPEDNIILIVESPSFVNYINQYCTKNNHKPLKLYCYRLLEYRCQKSLEFIPYEQAFSIDDASKDKIYLCFNNRARHHRPALCHLLNDLNLLQYGFYSMPKLGYDLVKKTFDNSALRYKDSFVDLKLSDTDLNNILPLVLDDATKVAFTMAHKMYDGFFNQIHYYKKSLINLVTETNYFHNEPIFLTEKIYRPVLHKQPFIVVSVPRTLEYFKSLGYKTFSHIIDESYDQIENDSKRLLAIADEIKRLSNFNQAEISDFIDQAKEICEHNYHVMSDFNKTFLTELN